MRNVFFYSMMLISSILMLAFTPVTGKLVTSKSHIKFFSSTPAEDIEANNYKAVGTIETSTGDVVFSVPMQSFEFKKSLMQKHFNQDKFLDTKAHPKAKLVGKITNYADINFAKNGTYTANIKGEMTIKGKTNPFSSKGTITVNGSEIKINSKFDIVLAEYGVEFVKGKPSKNIAKTVEVTVNADFQGE